MASREMVMMSREMAMACRDIASDTELEESEALLGRIPEVSALVLRQLVLRALAKGVLAVALLFVVILAFLHSSFHTAVDGTGARRPIQKAETMAQAVLQPVIQTALGFGPDATTLSGIFAAHCTMGTHERCRFCSMPRDKPTAVHPGGQTRCMLTTSSPYMFYVIPGDSDKLLLYFQGGGGCFDESSSVMGLCKQNVTYDGDEGIFDRNNSLNPFREYTLLIVTYCTGDAHAGNATNAWRSLPDGKAIQVGYLNARSVVDWAKNNIGASRLDSLVIAGSSAGSLGAQIWAKTLLKEFKYVNAAVIADSFVGVFPVGLQGKMLQRFGVCSTGLLDGTLLSDCISGAIDIQAVFADALAEFPQVAFASIDSKIDEVQIAYYELVRRTFGGVLADPIQPVQFAESLMEVYAGYNEKPNWVSYAVNSKQHMFLKESCLYSTVPDAAKLLEGVQFGEESLVKWLGNFPVPAGRSVSSVCKASIQHRVDDLVSGVGSMLHLNLTVPRLGLTGLSGMFACDPAVAHKTFTSSR